MKVNLEIWFWKAEKESSICKKRESNSIFSKTIAAVQQRCCYCCCCCLIVSWPSQKVKVNLKIRLWKAESKRKFGEKKTESKDKNKFSKTIVAVQQRCCCYLIVSSALQKANWGPLLLLNPVECSYMHLCKEQKMPKWFVSQQLSNGNDTKPTLSNHTKN